MSQSGKTQCRSTFSKNLLLLGAIMATSTLQAQSGVEDVVRSAIETNPEVQVRWHEFLAAGYGVDAARAGFRPNVDVNAGYGRQHRSYVPGRQQYNNGYAEVAVSQMLLDGARTRSQVSQMSNLQLVSYFEMLDTAENTALAAVAAYLDLQRQRDLVRLAEENLQTHQLVFNQIEESANAGVARAADLEQIAGRQSLAQTNLITEQSNLHDVIARYLRIVGDMPPQQMAQLQLAQNLPATVTDTLMQAYQSSPLYHAALRNIMAAEAATAVERGNTQPRLALTARVGGEERDEFGFMRDGRTDARIGLEFTYNLYTGGRDTANMRRSYAQENASKSVRDRACRDIRQTVQIAFNDAQRLAEQLPVLNQHRLSADRVRTAYSQQFDIGQRTLLDVLDSENEYFQASRAWVAAAYDQSIAVARTLAAQGKLLETLNVSRGDMPSLAELGAQPIDVDPASACPGISIYDTIGR
jgi:outer membrane protein, adhesin transport system